MPSTTKCLNRKASPFAANQLVREFRSGKRPSSILPLFPVAAVEKVDQIVGLFDGHVDQRDSDLDNRLPREHIDDVPRAFRCLLNVVALRHGV
ncbi:hypothetical protein MES4922_310011 [Mesorhizobium ventifaucium]|uniref:Uncharacterized protein n=1 Tax=Mesorhizobium ventifaucium TaxID=666020 RepID=A0ABN8K2L5_9HYPH|nr:hypothetical protein MES4922_310011 [Mesorhizobium ventifaucium]